MIELRGQVVDAGGLPALFFDEAVPAMPGDTLTLAPIVKSIPQTQTSH